MLWYLLTIVLSAFLLFQVQLIIAKFILPWFGGAASVWTTCMLFFQVLLTGGYAYAHIVASCLQPKRQTQLHITMLAVSLGLMAFQALSWHVPLLPGPGWRYEDSDFPVPKILLALAISAGLPFFLLSTTSSLLQSWFSRTNPGKSPYRLYALSNAGSLIGLLSYPFAVEPFLPLRMQSWVWAGLYTVFALSLALCGISFSRKTPAGRGTGAGGSAMPADAAAKEPADDLFCEGKPGWGRRTLWLVLPAAASVLLLATTNAISEELAVFPFLWVVPLAIYLLTFIICFDSPIWYARSVMTGVWLLAMGLIFVLVYNTYVDYNPMSFPRVIIIYSVALFACCMICHGELARLKPEPRYLTSYYLTISVGGALGGIFVGIVAPLVFTWIWELFLGYFLVGFLLQTVTLRERRAAIKDLWLWPYLEQSAAILLLLVLVPVFAYCSMKGTIVLMKRNFYGILRIREMSKSDADKRCLKLMHGQTLHGLQYQKKGLKMLPTSYFTKTSGIGIALSRHPRRVSEDPEEKKMRIGILGLGTGSIAAWGQEGDYIRFYEINSAVIEFSRGKTNYFTYVQDCPAKVDIVHGDGRIAMERELRTGQKQNFDVLAVDAFSGDSPPVHLMTKEAVELYLSHLREGGILAIHVSNRYLRLEKVVLGISDALGIPSVMITSPGDDWGAIRAKWMLLTRNREFLESDDVRAAVSEKPADYQDLGVWTDDYSNLFKVFRKSR